MKESKRQKLEAAGWKVSSAADFLGLSKEEESLIEMKIALANKLKACRREQRLTQLEVAKQIGSSQSRIAKMEVADESVSLDLLVRSLLSLGATLHEIAHTIDMPEGRKKGTRFATKKHAAAS
jgi:DNA-binding XRE family transcriptional regulator